jgi:FkbM family methyltransferase
MRLENIKFKNGNLSGITLHMDVNYSKMVFPNGNTDPEMISDIQNTNPEGKTILDVGAFIGSSSLLFSKLTKEHGKVIAFEPNLYNIKRIKKNFSLNKTLAKNIKLFELALLNIDGNIQMILNKQIDNGYSSTSRIVTSHPTLHNKDLPEGFEKRDVKVMKLDTFLEKNKFVPDIIKVDIEGSEYNFLNGAKETIKTHKPVLYIEIHSEYCAVKCYEILNSLGYHITILKEEDDNRIMVKAEHFKNRQPLSLDQKERILDSKIDQEQHI